jgi:hypothetical protein
MTLLALGLLTGCGQSGPASPTLFPLNEGWKWNYKVTTTSVAGSKVDSMNVRNLASVALTEKVNAIERRNSLGLSYYFVVQPSAITRVATKNQFETTARLDMEDFPRHVLPLPAKAGTKWMAMTRPFLLNRQPEALSNPGFARPFAMAFEIDAVGESVTVPAGTFNDCVIVSGQYSMPVMADAIVGMQLVPINQKEWYCPQVGMVKFIRAESITARLVTGGTMVMELVSLEH